MQDRAVRLAYWAHNPKVKGSNPFLAKLFRYKFNNEKLYNKN